MESENDFWWIWFRITDNKYRDLHSVSFRSVASSHIRTRANCGESLPLGHSPSTRDFYGLIAVLDSAKQMQQTVRISYSDCTMIRYSTSVYDTRDKCGARSMRSPLSGWQCIFCPLTKRTRNAIPYSYRIVLLLMFSDRHILGRYDAGTKFRSL